MVSGVFSDMVSSSKGKYFVGKAGGGGKEIWMKATILVLLVVVALLLLNRSTKVCDCSQCPSVQQCEECPPVPENCIGPGGQGTVPGGEEVPPVQGDGSEPAEIPNLAEMMQQKINVVSPYQCGANICFQIKAVSTNKVAVDMRIVNFAINGEKRPLVYWSGGVGGTSCDSLSVLKPGQNCYGKIENVSCVVDDVLNVSVSSGPGYFTDISGCK